MGLLLTGGRVVDPATGLDIIADVLVADGKVAAIGPNLPREGKQVKDVTGMWVVPGLIDIHVHLREPGEEDKETIATGTKSAAAGGFTSIACMPNTNPVIDTPGMVTYIKDKAKAEGVVNVYPISAITKGSQGKQLADLAMLQAAGAVAASDDGHTVEDSNLLRRALEYGGQLGLPIIEHCEDPSLSGDGVANEGFPVTVLGLKGIPAAAEEVIVARNICLAKQTGFPIHLAHISTAGSVALIREAKAKGVPVTAEVTPHHLTLTEEALEGFNPNAKVKPPLTTKADVEALRAGLRDGTIDLIATDHAPHTLVDKSGAFADAAFGISGLETAVGVILTELVFTNIFSLPDIIKKMTWVPAQVLGLQQGRLQVGAVADITVIDPEARWVVDPGQFASKGKNSPYSGKTLQGKPYLTMVNGQVVMEAGKVLNKGEEPGA
ncbi:MAG: dihydroorotase [bacterium]|jgi:dihydroorotase